MEHAAAYTLPRSPLVHQTTVHPRRQGDQSGGGAPFVRASLDAVLKGNLEAQVTAHLLPSTTNTYDLGSTTKTFRTIHGEATTAKYGDLAEMYAGDKDYEVGTVVVVGGTNEAELLSLLSKF